MNKNLAVIVLIGTLFLASTYSVAGLTEEITNDIQDKEISKLKKRVAELETEIKKAGRKQEPAPAEKPAPLQETKINELESKINSISAAAADGSLVRIKESVLLKFWYQHDEGAVPKDTFRVRYAEIKLSGEAKPVMSWAISFDPATLREDTTRKSPLQDCLITLKPEKFISIDFGQYSVPFGMEGTASSSKLDFVERSALTAQLKWANYRDIGVTCKGSFKFRGVEIFPALGIFNGEGQNTLNTNSSMDLAGRLILKPVASLHIGIAQYRAKSGAAEADNIRTGGELKFEQGPLFVKGEYATGKSGGKDKQTYYADLGYRFMKELQVVTRYDYYDTDLNKDNDAKTETIVGLNYFLDKYNSKVQLNYLFRNEEGALLRDDAVRLNVQVAY